VDRAQVRVFRERIAQCGLVIHEETERFGFQFVQVEACSKTDLHCQIGMLRVRRGAQCLGFRVEPFLDAAFGAEPRRMVVRVVGRKARDRGDAQYAGGFVGLAAMKVMLGQAAHQTIAPEQQRQRLDHGGLAAIIWPHQYGMAAQYDVRRTHASEAGDFQAGNMHFGAPSFPSSTMLPPNSPVTGFSPSAPRPSRISVCRQPVKSAKNSEAGATPETCRNSRARHAASPTRRRR